MPVSALSFPGMSPPTNNDEVVALKAWLDKNALHVPPKSALSKAVTYTLGKGESLFDTSNARP